MDPQTLTVVSICLTALGVAGAWLASILTRKGKVEDVKLAAGEQAFVQVQALSEARRAECEQLRAENARLRVEYEGRWDRQLSRCRLATDALVKALSEFRSNSTSAVADAVEALRQLQAHREDDHQEGSADQG